MRIQKHFESSDLCRDFDEIIHLGTCCETTYVIRKLGEIDGFNTTKTSFPFDWLATYDVQPILDLLENDFKDFFQLCYTLYEKYNNQAQLSLTYYSIVIPHHSPEAFLEKYPIKIDHFREALATKRILFILKCHTFNQTYKEQMERLVAILKNKTTHPFQILVVNEYDERIVAIVDDWNIPDVLQVSVIGDPRNYMNPNVDGMWEGGVVHCWLAMFPEPAGEIWRCIFDLDDHYLTAFSNSFHI